MNDLTPYTKIKMRSKFPKTPPYSETFAKIAVHLSNLIEKDHKKTDKASIEEKFKQNFPEFSLEIIKWFRKNKHLL